ncbi:hypothetical protein [Synechococcus sp. PCC 7335]|uniref:hypothetical protein n=1 Tax=Synechococcus sp. (strain ATCC 29403 / PCC 7335) TaxID=91464 RepID=UPI00057012C7|nr:hypothetical protein [Synechococcus sp. PCC 7335]
MQIEPSTDSEETGQPQPTPSVKGRLVGCIVVRPTGEALFYSYKNEKSYYTYNEYAEWPGMVCEAEVDGQFAYKIFVENTGTGKIVELPSVEVIQQFPTSKDCRCPFCMLEHQEALDPRSAILR